MDARPSCVVNDAENIQVQKSGLVYKLPWSGKAKSWKRRYFVVKDGYMMYYKKMPAPGKKHFDTHPKGILPLGETKVEAYVPKVAPPPGHHAFRVWHKSFGTGSLVACVESKQALDEWIKVLRDSSRVTWEAAVYGDSLINQLREKGAALIEENEKSLLKAKSDAEAAIKLKEEREKALVSHQSALDLATKKKQEIEESLAKASEKELHKANAAAKLKEINDQAVSLAQTQSNLQEKHEELLKSHSSATLLLQKTKSQADQIAKKKEEAEAKLQEVNRKRANMLKKHTSRLDEEALLFSKFQEDLNSEREKRALLEKQVKEAEESLKHLDQALRKSGVKVDIDVTADVKNLTSFFEETVGNMKKEKEEFELKVKLKSGKKEHIEAVTPKNVGITMVEDTYVEDDDNGSSSDEEDDEEISEDMIAKGALLFTAIVDNNEDCREISMEQFSKAVATPKSIELSEEDKKQLFTAIDQDNDGKISMDEFVAYFASYSEYLYDVFDAVVPNSANETQWYYLNTNGETVGPYSLMQFIQLYQQKVITDDTNVWNADIETWHVLKTVNSLVSHIQKS